jgi:hypothetical protein
MQCPALHLRCSRRLAIDMPTQVRQVPIAEAATLLGVSVDTIKRRIRSGALQGNRDARGRLLVDVPGMEPAPQPSANAPHAAPQMQGNDAEVATLQERVAAVTAERDWLRERVERAESEREQLRILLSNAQQSLVRALQAAPQQPQEPALDASGPPKQPAMATEAALWWRRWRLWLAGAGAMLVLGSASCQTASPLAESPTICAAARQHLRYWDGVAKDGQSVRPAGAWLPTLNEHGDFWQELTTVVSFVKTYC